MECQYDPIELYQKIFDLVELECDMFMKHPKRREKTKWQITFFNDQLKEYASNDFGRLCNRLSITEIVHDLQHIEFCSSDELEKQIENIQHFKNNICRNDATTMVPLPRTVKPKQNEGGLTYDAMVEQVRDNSENKARASSLEKDFQKILKLMRLQQGLIFSRHVDTIDEAKEIGYFSIDKLREFVSKYFLSEPELETFGKQHLLRMITLEEKIHHLRSKEEDEKAETELLRRFLEHSDFCNKNLFIETEKVMLKCYSMLPTPTLVQLRYDEHLLNRTTLSFNSDTKNSREDKSDSNMSKTDERSTSNEKVETHGKKCKEDFLEDESGRNLSKTDETSTLNEKVETQGKKRKEDFLEDESGRHMSETDERSKSNGKVETHGKKCKEDLLEDESGRHMSETDERSKSNEKVETHRKKRKKAVKQLKDSSGKVNEDALDEAVEIAKQATTSCDDDESTMLSTISKGSKTPPDKDFSVSSESTTNNIIKKKKGTRVMWTEKEDEALQEGIFICGLSRWSSIKSSFPVTLKNRTNVQIKDRYRVLNRLGKIKYEKG